MDDPPCCCPCNICPDKDEVNIAQFHPSPGWCGLVGVGVGVGVGVDDPPCCCPCNICPDKDEVNIAQVGRRLYLSLPQSTSLPLILPSFITPGPRLLIATSPIWSFINTHSPSLSVLLSLIHHSFTLSLTHSLTHSLIHSLTHSFVYISKALASSTIHLLPLSLSHSLINSLIHPLTQSFTHSLTH